jgi:DNA adenine methylase
MEPTPFVKWAGGKTQLLKQMDQYFPSNFGTYFEPFLGGGAVFFHLRPAKAVLSDSNPELVTAFEVVRDHPNELMAALRRHAAKTREQYYYEVRAQDPTSLAPIERAARFIFLNKTCFNGLYRVNAKGQFNVPYGGYYPNRKPTLFDAVNLRAASAALRRKTILLAGYRDALTTAIGGDLVYLDPPYHALSATSGFTSYTKESFGDKEQRELAATARDLDARGCLFMLSNSPTSLVRSLYSKFEVDTLTARRAINSKGTGRGEIAELLVRNFG